MIDLKGGDEKLEESKIADLYQARSIDCYVIHAPNSKPNG
jgi:hypothetical protein